MGSSRARRGAVRTPAVRPPETKPSDATHARGGPVTNRAATALAVSGSSESVGRALVGLLGREVPVQDFDPPVIPILAPASWYSSAGGAR